MRAFWAAAALLVVVPGVASAVPLPRPFQPSTLPAEPHTSPEDDLESVYRPYRIPVANASREVVIAFTGDTLIHRNVAAAAARNGSPYDFGPLFDPVAGLISGADLALCHLEVPLSPENTDLSSFPRFNAPRQVAEALAEAGFDGCSTASNHSFDQGVDGVLGTMEVLAEAGLGQAGMARSEAQAWRPALYDLGGGLVVAHISATYWLNGLLLPLDRPWLVQLLDADRIISMGRRAKATGADLVVVSVHCCVEYSRQPSPYQLETLRALVTSPYVDLVVAHYSHLVGPVEKVGDEFVVHGLGNFLSGQGQFPGLRDGVIVMARAEAGADGWRFTGIEAVPTRVVPGVFEIVPAEPGSPSYRRTMDALGTMGVRVPLFNPNLIEAQRRGLID
jgi:poly-gamma-glutamate synthesis protein (capsule biosynthesis protein)